MKSGGQLQSKNNLQTINPDNHYYSVSKLSYQSYGNPNQIKARLDDERRLDLRRSHFKVGKESTQMIS